MELDVSLPCSLAHRFSLSWARLIHSTPSHRISLDPFQYYGGRADQMFNVSEYNDASNSTNCVLKSLNIKLDTASFKRIIDRPADWIYGKKPSFKSW